MWVVTGWPVHSLIASRIGSSVVPSSAAVAACVQRRMAVAVHIAVRILFSFTSLRSLPLPTAFHESRASLNEIRRDLDRTRQMFLERQQGKEFEILVFVAPRFNMAATVWFLDPFRVANYLDGQPLFRWSIVSAEGGEVLASSGM